VPWRLSLNGLKIQSCAEVVLKNTVVEVRARTLQCTVGFGPFSPVSSSVTFLLSKPMAFSSSLKKRLLKLQLAVCFMGILSLLAAKNVVEKWASDCCKLGNKWKELK